MKILCAIFGHKKRVRQGCNDAYFAYTFYECKRCYKIWYEYEKIKRKHPGVFK